MKAKRLFFGAAAVTLFAALLIPVGITPRENSVTLDPAIFAVRVVPGEVAFTVPKPSAPVAAGTPLQIVGSPSRSTDELKADSPFSTDQFRFEPESSPAPRSCILLGPMVPTANGKDPRYADPGKTPPRTSNRKPLGASGPNTKAFAG